MLQAHAQGQLVYEVSEGLVSLTYDASLCAPIVFDWPRLYIRKYCPSPVLAVAVPYDVCMYLPLCCTCCTYWRLPYRNVYVCKY